MLSYTYLEETFGIKKNLITLAKESETELKEQFSRMDGIAEYNQLKVLHAMQKNRLSESHFVPTTGYGYHDAGRNVLEEIYTDVFKAESALVRPQIISGTHALTTALFSCLHHGDELLSAVGKPYDTLESVIGIRPARGSLAEYGITYRQAELVNGCVDWGNLKREINSKTKVVLIQRSKGYAWRKSLTNLDIGELIGRIKSIRSDLICLVDNCYGEFVDTDEPIEFGADLVVGSLIKNPGGGIAPVGGYIAGKKEYVENAAARLTAPGLGKEVGPSLGLTKALTQGLFFAPQAVNASVKAAIFAAHILEKLGFETLPRSTEPRADIVQAIKLLTPDRVIAFCRGVQKAAAVDSFVTPEPWAMPGYDAPVIMAAGAFTQGSSIELSADAPMKEPYIVYFQGGLTWLHAKFGVIITINNIL